MGASVSAGGQAPEKPQENHVESAFQSSQYAQKPVNSVNFKELHTDVKHVKFEPEIPVIQLPEKAIEKPLNV